MYLKIAGVGGCWQVLGPSKYTQKYNIEALLHQFSYFQGDIAIYIKRKIQIGLANTSISYLSIYANNSSKKENTIIFRTISF